MNKDLSRLQRYPFEKLAELIQGLEPPAHLDHISLSIGEPRHPSPRFVIDSLIAHLHQLSNYPTTRGIDGLRETIAAWICRRFAIEPALIDPQTRVLPVSGTREALFAIAQTVIDRGAPEPLVLMPNPFYQIYEGAALLAGAQPRYLDCLPADGFLPDLDSVSADEWSRCQLIYICSPGNPTGAVMPTAYLQRLIELADEHDFVIASDECYSEIYFDESSPPPGLLGAAAEMGNDSFAHCLAFHSLSKRSSLPGLRSGFVAGDAQILQQFLLYRTYHGCALPPATQTASIAAWKDETHVIENRARYREKFDRVSDLLSGTLAPQRPDAGFYFWAATPVSDTEFARRLYAEHNVSVLPGSYLSRNHAGSDPVWNDPAWNDPAWNDPAWNDPGAGRVRIALVAPLDECLDAAKRINALYATL